MELQVVIAALELRLLSGGIVPLTKTSTLVGRLGDFVADGGR
jgi:hypothetical protein